MNDHGHWITDHTPEAIQNAAGFIYLITNLLTGQMYVGKKFCWSLRRIKQKGSTRRKHTKTPSNWRTYTSSSESVNAAIQEHGKDNFKFEILTIHPTRSEVNFAELQEQVDRRVLTAIDEEGNYLYENKNILGKYFRR